MLTPEGTVFREFEDAFESSLPSSLTEEERDLVVRNALSIGMKVFTKLPPSIRREATQRHTPPVPAVPVRVDTAPVVPAQVDPVVSTPVDTPIATPSEVAMPEFPPKPLELPEDRPKRSRPFRPIRPVTTPKAWKKWNDAQFMALTRDTQSWMNHRVSTQEEVLDWYDIRHHLLVLYTLAKCVNWPDPRDLAPKQPPTILEIGVRHGISTLVLLTACRETGGRLISLEIDPEWGQDATEVVQRAQLERWWQLEICDSATYEMPTDTLDLLWIDGSHEEKDVRRDFTRYSPYVRSGGFIALHDYFQLFAEHGTERGVSHVVEAARMSGAFEVLILPWSHGLALLRVL